MAGSDGKEEEKPTSFLRNSINAFAKTNERWAEFQAFRDEHIETLLEYTFGLVDPPLIRRLYPMVPDENATAQRLKGRFPWLVLLDYVLDCDGSVAREVEKYMSEFAMLLEMTQLEDSRMVELSSYVLCEFKLQTCLSYVREKGERRLSNEKIKEKIAEIYGDVDVTAENLLSSQNREKIVTQSLLAAHKEELDVLFDVTKKGKCVIDDEQAEILAEEHPWSEFADCMKHYIQQLQLSAFGFPKLMSMLGKAAPVATASEEAKVATPTIDTKQSERMKKLKRTFFKLGGSQKDWDSAAEKAEANFEAFEHQIKKFNRRLGKKMQPKKSLPVVRISSLEQYNDEAVDDANIIGSGFFAESTRFSSPKRSRPAQLSRAAKKPRLATDSDVQSAEESNTDIEFPEDSHKDDESDTESQASLNRESQKKQKGESSATAKPSAAASKGSSAGNTSNNASNNARAQQKAKGSSAAGEFENVNAANVARQSTNPLRKKTGLKLPKKRVRWSAEELSALRYGVAEFGEGNWAKILKMSTQFHTCRDAVSLKDKWRNIRLKEEREAQQS